ncbi:MAG TPA: hypothetical protein VJB87_00885 [Candidatus Nanoarchaeia archaeon]|nr:hypothetical protein [Candidatus Nanoarchaeia archaeon]
MRRPPHTIEFYYHPESPTRLDDLVLEVKGDDFSACLTAEDYEVIAAEWPHILALNPKAVSFHQGLLCLKDTSRVGSDGVLEFCTTDFATYVAASRTSERGRPLSSVVYDTMRVGAVGGAVYSVNDFVLVHKRPVTATHVADRRDASIAGLVRPDAEGNISMRSAFREKLTRELGLFSDEVDDIFEEKNGFSIRCTDVHSSSAPDCSGMVDAVIRVPLTQTELALRISPQYLVDVDWVHRNALPDYVVNHFLSRHGTSEALIPDGVAALMSSLDADGFAYVRKRLGHDIAFGALVNGVFVKE